MTNVLGPLATSWRSMPFPLWGPGHTGLHRGRRLIRRGGYVCVDSSGRIKKTHADGAGHTFVPVASAWTIATVLSIRTHSESGESAIAWNSLAQTSACDQRRNRSDPHCTCQTRPAGHADVQRPGHLQDCVYDQPVVGTAAPPGSARTTAFDPLPLLVRQRAPAQDPAPLATLKQNGHSNEVSYRQPALWGLP